MSWQAAIIAIAAFAAWTAFAWRDRAAALAVFAALLPAYLIRLQLPMPIIGRLPTTALELTFLGLFIAWAAMDGRKPEAWRTLRDWSGPISLFLVAATVAVAVAPDTLSALGLWRAYVVEPILLFVMATDVLTRRGSAAAVLAALGATLAVVGVSAVFQKITGIGIPNPHWAAVATRRVTSFYGFPNAVGLYAAPVTALMAAWALALVKRGAKLRAMAAATAFLLGAAAILFAVSEGAAIGLAAGLVVVGLADRRLRPWTLGAGIFACLDVIAVPQLRDYASLLLSLRDDSGYVRRIIWSETTAMLADNPVFGTGLSGYPAGIAPYHAATWIEVFQYPHNILLNFWSETGLLGIAAFGWILARLGALIAAGLKRSGEWLWSGLTAAFVAMLVHGLVDVPYFKNDLAMLFWLLTAIAVALARRQAGAGIAPEREA